MIFMQDKARAWSHIGRFRSTFGVGGNTMMTSNHIAVQVRSSGKGQAKIGPSSWKGLNMDAKSRLWFVANAVG